jgi:hypothetical protein
MTQVYDQDSDVYFGEAGNPLPNWRLDPELLVEEDPDDELLPETPEDVIAVLGFDPLELFES